MKMLQIVTHCTRDRSRERREVGNDAVHEVLKCTKHGLEP